MTTTAKTVQNHPDDEPAFDDEYAK